MNQVKAGAEFLNLGEEEILAALDRFEESDDDCADEGEPEDPIVREVGWENHCVGRNLPAWISGC